MTSLQILEGDEEAKVIAQVREIIAQKPRARDVAHWERGWKENLEVWHATHDIDALRPKYIRPGLPLRHNGRFVMATDPDFEWRWYKKFREQISDRWLADSHEIMEIGCGSGHNIAWLKARYPGKHILGLDWSPSAVQIASEVADGGVLFDMLNPPPDKWSSLRNTTVLTIGAMEQTGRLWGPMLNWLIACKPKRVVHIEPILDWYNPDNIVDLTAIEAHQARGFWTGYIDALIKLMDEGRIEVENTQRSWFGSLLCEGYSQIIWRSL